MAALSLSRVRDYLAGLEETRFWALLVEYLSDARQIRAHVVHGPGEHGMDVVAYVHEAEDFLNRGYYVVIQAKTGDLNLDDWRKVLYQLLEVPYFPIPCNGYDDPGLPRRVLVAVTGSITAEARESIKQYNIFHRIKVETLEGNDLMRLPQFCEYVNSRLDQTQVVGEAPLPDLAEGHGVPPVLGVDERGVGIDVVTVTKHGVRRSESSP